MMNGERNHQHMRSFLSQLEERCLPATLECMPDNTDAMTGHGLLRGMDLRTVDCSDWTPEVPEQIGIYHAYLRGFNRDVRTHRLFVVCSGGLERACDAFCNLMIDVGQKCTAEARVFVLFCCFVCCLGGLFYSPRRRRRSPSRRRRGGSGGPASARARGP